MHSALGGREEGALVMLELCPTRTPLAPLLAIALRLHFDKLPNAAGRKQDRAPRPPQEPTWRVHVDVPAAGRHASPAAEVKKSGEEGLRSDLPVTVNLDISQGHRGHDSDRSAMGGP